MTESHEPDDDLFEIAPCGFVLVGDTGLITRANAEFRRLVDRRNDDLVGKVELASLFSAGGRIFLETHLLPMLEHDRSVREVALDLVRRDGSRVPVLLNADTAQSVDAAIRVVVVETRERHRYEQDLLTATKDAQEARLAATALANALQQTLIPPVPPQIPRLTVATAYRPAGDGSIVGGDFFDIFKVGVDDWCLVLGDVSGKGTSAATVTSFVRYTIRALAIDHPDPSELLERLDRAMHDSGTEHYCTLVVARLAWRAPRWVVHLALAGHPAALVRRTDGSLTELGTPGTPVGLVDSPTFSTVRHLLDDETITFYTDGVTEARAAGGLYGEARLHELLARCAHDPHAITDAIVREALRYQGGMANDDIAIVTLAAAPS